MDAKAKPRGGEWTELNDALRGCTLARAEQLLREERRGPNRKQFLLRIQSRINRLRSRVALAEIERRT